MCQLATIQEIVKLRNDIIINLERQSISNSSFNNVRVNEAIMYQ